MPPNRHDQISFVRSDLRMYRIFAERLRCLTNASFTSAYDCHQRQQELDQLKDQFMITASHELRRFNCYTGYIELIAHTMN